MSGLWNEVRGEFAAATRHVYLNAAAASPVPRCVREAVDGFMRQFAEHGDLAWDAWIGRREAVRTRLARFIGADAEEVAFVPNTSTGINVIADLLEPDGGVLSDTLEFPTVTLPWIHRGVPVRFIEPREGVVDPADFADGRHDPAATVLISHVQYSNGCRQDLAVFGACKGRRHLVVCASQSAGAFPIDVRAHGIDALASAGHKWMCAGYGAGFLYVSRTLLQRRPRTMGWMSVEDPFEFDNRQYRLLATAQRYELGCPSFSTIVALGASVDFLDGIGIDAIAARVLALNTYLTDQLQAAGFEVLSPGGVHRSGETLCRIPTPAAAVAWLRERDILVTEKPEGLRIATHIYNTEADIDCCVAALRAYVTTLSASARAAASTPDEHPSAGPRA